jgi:hypothetical protein
MALKRILGPCVTTVRDETTFVLQPEGYPEVCSDDHKAWLFGLGERMKRRKDENEETTWGSLWKPNSRVM